MYTMDLPSKLTEYATIAQVESFEMALRGELEDVADVARGAGDFTE